MDHSSVEQGNLLNLSVADAHDLGLRKDTMPTLGDTSSLPTTLVFSPSYEKSQYRSRGETDKAQWSQAAMREPFRLVVGVDLAQTQDLFKAECLHGSQNHRWPSLGLYCVISGKWLAHSVCLCLVRE